MAADRGDPNADLIGYCIRDADGRVWNVLRTIWPGLGYVEIGSGPYRSVRAAELVRRHRQLSRQEGGTT